MITIKLNTGKDINLNKEQMNKLGIKTYKVGYEPRIEVSICGIRIGYIV